MTLLDLTSWISFFLPPYRRERPLGGGCHGAPRRCSPHPATTARRSSPHPIGAARRRPWGPARRRSGTPAPEKPPHSAKEPGGGSRHEQKNWRRSMFTNTQRQIERTGRYGPSIVKDTSCSICSTSTCVFCYRINIFDAKKPQP
jgi:hypothetical protein